MKIDRKKRGRGSKKEPLTLIACRLNAQAKADLDFLIARAKAAGHRGNIKSAVIRQAIKDTAEEIARSGPPEDAHRVVCSECHNPAPSKSIDTLIAWGWRLWLGGAKCPSCIARPAQVAAWQATDHKTCQAGRDGECNWVKCPQLRDAEPIRSGRHCPLDTKEEE